MSAAATLIVPSSASGSGTITLQSDGRIDFTTMTSLTVEDVFSATYLNYWVVMRLTSTANTALTPQMQLRVGGSTATGTNYLSQFIQGRANVVNAARENTTLHAMGIFRNESLVHTYIYGPNLASTTQFYSLMKNSDPNDFRLIDYATAHGLSTAYTSFVITPNAASMTGSIWVYGMTS